MFIRSSQQQLGRATVLVAALLAAPFTHAQDAGSDLAQAFKDGKFNVAFRYRFENVDEDPFTRDANASTLRSRLTFQTASWHALTGLIEMDDLRSVGDDNYNSTRNGETTRPTVADPEATDLNQFALKYTGLENAEIVLGRQRIARGNERFIGPVGWRQNEQTMDSASIAYNFSPKLQAYYAFINQVNRVFGPDQGVPPEDFTGASHVADVTYTFGPMAKLMAYGYFLDLEEAPTGTLPRDSWSNQTLGLRLSGDVALGNDGVWSIPYAVEYATQDDYADNPANYEADYYLAEAGVRWQKLTVKLAREVLEGDTEGSFQTPLATLHAFQGWADKFTATPTRGIEDNFVVAEYAHPKFNLKLRYDQYSTEQGSSDDYGDEFGAWLTVPVGKNYSAGLKYASFSEDSERPANGPRDTDKFWVILTANF